MTCELLEVRGGERKDRVTIRQGGRDGAEDGARTRDLILGKDVLYQLSYFRLLRGAEGQNRTDDTSIFSAVLYLLSYLGASIHVNLGTPWCQGKYLENLTCRGRADH